MASVTVYSTERVDSLIQDSVVGASISGGNLILHLRDETTINVGPVASDATDTTKGIVELATDAETIEGTDSTKVITPLSLSSLTGNQSRNGLVRFGTTSEVAEGTSFSRAVAPATLASVLQGFLGKIVSRPADPPLETDDPNTFEFSFAGTLRTWWNEWFALRGRNPYTTWADSLVRAIVMDNDNTSGNAFEIEDRRTGANGRKIWGVNWGTGRMVQNGNQVGTVYVLTAAQTVSDIPSTLPIGTLVVQRTS